MSTIKVDAIRSNSASSDAITLDGNGKCAVTGTTVTATTGKFTNLPNRNIIINGAMRVAQRGTSNTNHGYGSVDRFAVYHNNVDEAPTHAQVDVASGTTPYTLGFRKALRVTNGNQTSGAGTNDHTMIQTKQESQDIAQSGWNYTSASSYITLSFWVKSSVAQNFYCYFRTKDGTEQIYPFETGSLTADTWTKITKTIPGHANLQFDNDANQGTEINISPYTGTYYTDSSVTLNAWGAYSGTARTPDHTSTWWTTNDATFEITGVQLEVGDSATDFEHLSFQEDYLRCARYYIQMNRLPVMTNRVAGHVSCTTRFNPVPMRAIPSVSIDATLSLNVFFYGSGTPTSTNTPGFQNNGDSGQPYGGDNMILNFSGFSSSNFQTNEMGEVHGTTIRIDAEL